MRAQLCPCCRQACARHAPCTHRHILTATHTLQHECAPNHTHQTPGTSALPCSSVCPWAWCPEGRLDEGAGWELGWRNCAGGAREPGHVASEEDGEGEGLGVGAEVEPSPPQTRCSPRALELLGRLSQQTSCQGLNSSSHPSVNVPLHGRDPTPGTGDKGLHPMKVGRIVTGVHVGKASRVCRGHSGRRDQGRALGSAMPSPRPFQFLAWGGGRRGGRLVGAGSGPAHRDPQLQSGKPRVRPQRRIPVREHAHACTPTCAHTRTRGTHT